jgi:hypothetical protein
LETSVFASALSDSIPKTKTATSFHPAFTQRMLLPFSRERRFLERAS